MSDTPETDKVAMPVIGFYSCATVTADFARKLERERNEARLQYGSTHALAEVLVKSRNEFLEALRDIANMDVAEGARAIWRAKEALK